MVRFALMFLMLTVRGPFRLRHSRPDSTRLADARDFRWLSAGVLLGEAWAISILPVNRPGRNWPGLMATGLPVCLLWKRPWLDSQRLAFGDGDDSSAAREGRREVPNRVGLTPNCGWRAARTTGGYWSSHQ